MNLRLTELRKEADLTQATLAQALGITQADVSRYEASGEIPSRLLKRWASTIGCTIYDLLPGDDLPVEEKPIFDFYESLYGSLTADLNSLLQDIDQFPHLGESVNESVGPIVEQFRERMIALKEKPWVVVAGHFDAGKSHLCNFYLGGERLPTGYRPVTKFPTFIRHISDRPQWFKEDVWLMGSGFKPEKWDDEDHCKEKQILAGSWDMLEEQANLKDMFKSMSEAQLHHQEKIKLQAMLTGTNDDSDDKTVLAFVDAPLLHACVLVDLPGYDDIMTHASIIDRLGRRAAILLYLSRAQGFLDGGDLVCLGHLLRVLPEYKKLHNNFPMLGNLFIIASHAHYGISGEQLENQILDGGSKSFYDHFKGTLLAKLNNDGQSISSEDIRNRFFSFYQEIPKKREKLEEALRLLLEEHMPSIQRERVSQEILKFKEEGKTICAKEIDKYKKFLSEKEKVKRHYEKLRNGEPNRKKRHVQKIEHIEREILEFKEQDLKKLRAVFEEKTEIRALETMIKKHYKDKNRKEAQMYASTYVLEEIQSETERFRGNLVARINKRVEDFMRQYHVQIGKLGDGGIEELSIPFNTKEAFARGLVDTFGGVTGGASITGAGTALGIAFLSRGAAATTIVSALGGPIALALGVAVAMGFWPIFGDRWERRLARYIKDILERENVLFTLDYNVRSYWDKILTGFQNGANSLDKQWENHIKELRNAVDGNQEERWLLEERLKRCEEIKSFFSNILW